MIENIKKVLSPFKVGQTESHSFSKDCYLLVPASICVIYHREGL